MVRALSPSPEVLCEAVANRELSSKGYTVVRLIDAPAADAIRAGFGALHGWERNQLVDDQPPDFEISVWQADPAYQEALTALFDHFAGEAIAGLFVSHRAVASSVMVKWPSVDPDPGWLGVPDAFHADSTCVDERTGARGYRMWIALQDVDAAGGGLEVVPGTHRVETGIRGWGVEPSWLQHRQVLADRAVPLSLRAGEAVIFAPALVHRSGPNRRSSPRVAVSVLLVEPDEPMCIFRRRDEHTAERVSISPSFFHDGSYNTLGSMPGGDVVALEPLDLSAAALAALLDRLVTVPD